MKLISQYKHPENWRFAIEDEGAGEICLYIYEHFELFEDDLREGDVCCPRHQLNYAQSTFEMAQSYAYRHHGVPLDSWIEVPESK
jgi:hypothetical protein